MNTRVIDLLAALSNRIVAGASLEESLEFIFAEFSTVIPFDRIGFAEVDEKERLARARWFKSRRHAVLDGRYSAPLTGSSLALVLQYRQPRILHDLPAYLRAHPKSVSTALIVREGMRSSMTCPLFLADRAFGFLFFSSAAMNTYHERHVEILRSITAELTVLLHISQLEPHGDQAGALPPDSPKWREEENQHLPSGVATTSRRPTQCPLSELQPRMIVGAPVILPNGRVLVASGVELTAHTIARLTALYSHGYLPNDAFELR